MATTKIIPDVLDLNEATSDSGLKIPTGTNNNRPATDVAGMIRNNTNESSDSSASCEEYYNGTAWQKINNVAIPVYYRAVLYTGNGGTQAITGVGFKPDFVWIKERGGAENNYVQDSTRGSTQQIYTNQTAAQFNETTAVTSFDDDGFTMGSYSGINNNGDTYVAWCWKANGGTTSSNTDGTITSTVQANEDAGFSIISYNGNGTSGATIGHGLSVAPDFLIFKRLNATESWNVWSSSVSSKVGFLNLTDAFINYSVLGTDTSTITLNNGTGHNASSSPYICYAFASTDSFSKFGSYTGNGSTNGPIVETGFEPAFIMIKQTDDVANWCIVDNKRSTTNPRNKTLRANSDVSEATVGSTQLVVDFLSNGFQLKQTSGNNVNNGNFIYMAFAADPDTEAPTVAKSFSTVAWTGDGTARDIPVGFKPNLVWIKSRSFGRNHYWYDSIRGANKQILSNATDAEATITGRLTAFNTDSFSIGTSSEVNNNNETYVAWAWKADDNEPTVFGGSALAVYKFEDNANDARGNYNGTTSNITYSTGKFNKAASFVVGNSSKINFSNSLHGSSFSMSFWMKATDMGTGTSATSYSIYSAWIDVNNYFRPVLYGDGSLLLLTKYSGTFKSNLTATGIITENTWHHIVFNFTPLDTNAYVDGVNVGTFPSYDTISFTSKDFGTNRSTPDFTGDIDQLRFYDTALTQENVTELYNETASDNDDLTFGAPGETIISANANAGFSIVKYQGDGVSVKQVPHGLSAAPDFIVVKSLDSAYNWMVYASPEGENKHAYLNLTNVFEDPSLSVWNDTAPTSTVFSISNNANVNLSGENYIAYCFHSVSGYSKIGSYTGNASTNAITGLGFQPDWILARRTDTADNWAIIDSVRETYLLANLTDTEATYNWFEFTSDGFTLSTSTLNASGGTYIYMAFKIN